MSNDQATSTFNLGRTEPVEIGVNGKIRKLYKIGQIFFPTNVKTLDSQDKYVLYTIAKSYEIILLGHPDLSLFFIGYADHRGKIKYNLRLADKRANSVAEYFKKFRTFRDNQNWGCVVETRGEKESYQPSGSSKVPSGRKHLKKIMRLERRVYIYSNICAAPVPITTGDLLVSVTHEKTKKTIEGVTISVEYGARSKINKTDSRGKIKYEDLDVGAYSVYCDDENYKLMSWKDHRGSGASGSDKAEVAIRGGLESRLELKLLKQYRAPKKWIQKVFISKAGPSEPEFKTRTTIVEGYVFVIETKVEIKARRKNWMLDEIGILGPLARYQIWRYEATYDFPSLEHYAGEFWDNFGKLKDFFTRDADVEMEVYRSWDAYPKREGDLLEKYRPPKK